MTFTAAASAATTTITDKTSPHPPSMFPSTLLPSSGLGGPLYHKDEMPEHFHEHFIVTGYRHPKSSAWQCVLSLFDATNETLNFWTHFLPSWYFMWVLKGLSETLDFRHDPYTWPLLCYMFACCMFPLASAVAHTFNVMSERARHVCFFLDYAALSSFCVGVAVSYHAYCFPPALMASGYRSWYVPGAVVCAVFCTACSCGSRFLRPGARHQRLRLFSCSLPFFFTSFPISYRLLLCAPEEEEWEEEGEVQPFTARTLHRWQFIFVTLSAFLYASHLPERWKPGQFDIIGHSHQLFHVTAILGVVTQIEAVLRDMRGRRDAVGPWVSDHLKDSVGVLALVLMVNALIVALYSLYLFLATNPNLRRLTGESDAGDSSSSSNSSSNSSNSSSKCKRS